MGKGLVAGFSVRHFHFLARAERSPARRLRGWHVALPGEIRRHTEPALRHETLVSRNALLRPGPGPHQRGQRQCDHPLPASLHFKIPVCPDGNSGGNSVRVGRQLVEGLVRLSSNNFTDNCVRRLRHASSPRALL